MAEVGAVVPAAGRGARFGGATPKAFAPLHGKPLLAHTLHALQASRAVGWIVVAARDEDRAKVERLARAHGVTKVRAVVEGGASRADSVLRGIEALPAEAVLVMIHDGARPCVTPALIEAVLAEAKRSGAAACGLPAWLTVKAVDERRRVRLTLDRSSLWFVQTPQAFRRDWIDQAAATIATAPATDAGDRFAAFPDDAAMLEWAGFPVTMVPGDPLNIKVTTPEDRILAEAILRARPGGVSRRRQAARR